MSRIGRKQKASVNPFQTDGDEVKEERAEESAEEKEDEGEADERRMAVHLHSKFSA